MASGFISSFVVIVDENLKLFIYLSSLPGAPFHSTVEKPTPHFHRRRFIRKDEWLRYRNLANVTSRHVSECHWL